MPPIVAVTLVDTLCALMMAALVVLAVHPVAVRSAAGTIGIALHITHPSAHHPAAGLVVGTGTAVRVAFLHIPMVAVHSSMVPAHPTVHVVTHTSVVGVPVVTARSGHV